jgi:hypothetical protein
VSQALDLSAAHHHHHPQAGDRPLHLIAQPREGPVPRGLLQSGVADYNEIHTMFPRDSSNGEEEEEQARTTSSINNNNNNNMPEAEEESSCRGYSDTSCREKYEDALETIDVRESFSNSVVENGKDFSRGEVSSSTNESDPAIAIALAKGVQLDEGFTAIDITKEEEEKHLGKGGGGSGPERTISMLSLDNLECCRSVRQFVCGKGLSFNLLHDRGRVHYGLPNWSMLLHNFVCRSRLGVGYWVNLSVRAQLGANLRSIWIV